MPGDNKGRSLVAWVMGKSKNRTPKTASPAKATAPFNNPFAALGPLSSSAAPGGRSAAGDDEASAPSNEASAATASATDWSVGGKIILRYERKGHGGKTATVVTGMVLRGIELREFARDIGKKLGCAARVEGNTVVIAGDQRERAEPLLRARGARLVVRA